MIALNEIWPKCRLSPVKILRYFHKVIKGDKTEITPNVHKQTTTKALLHIIN